MLLTMKEQNKIEVIQHVMVGTIEVDEAGRVLNRSVRQIYRMLKNLKDKGLDGLQHGNKGKKSPRKIKKAIRKRIIKLVQGKLKDINDTHLTEILVREEKMKLSRPSVRNILREAGIPAKLKHRSPKHRSRRERKEAFGMMLQIDASRHDWLEGRGPWLTIVGGIDDATNFAWARVVDAETTWAYLDLLEEIALNQGLPVSLYSDRHSIFYVLREATIEEQIKNKKALTQFGRAMEELGIHLIKAYSPQAKGRIERFWKTLQDRLVVDLRLAGAKTKQEAQKVLETFLQEYNRKFILPVKQESVFRKAPKASDLSRILCLKETRTVAKDHTISFEGLVFQIPPSKIYRSLANRKVDVLQLKDGSVEIVYKQTTVARFQPEAVSRLAEIHGDKKCQLKKAA